MVIACAGRRIDAPNAAEARFPGRNAALVVGRIEAALRKLGATVTVSSAACGADILALEAAGRLGIRRRVVLPFNRSRFRESSVVDRPGDWGERYDRVMNEVEQDGDEVILGFEVGDERNYFATNDRILAEAAGIARFLGANSAAMIVWDGKSRGPDDVTAHFLSAARQADLVPTEIRTLD